MNLQCLRLRLIFSFSIFLCFEVVNGHSDFKILDQNFNEIQDDELLKKLQKLDSHLKRNLFYIPTDQVITDEQINHVIHAVSLKSNIKLTDAVTAIVNVKLIKRLQFDSIAYYYAGCLGVVEANSSLPLLAVENSNSDDHDIALLDLGSSQPRTNDVTIVSDASSFCSVSLKDQQSSPGQNKV